MKTDKEILEDAKKLFLFEREQEAFTVGALSMQRQMQAAWNVCSHKEVLQEGNYNILLKIGGDMETIVLFKAGKGGKEIPYAHAKAYFKIPAPPKKRQ